MIVGADTKIVTVVVAADALINILTLKTEASIIDTVKTREEEPSFSRLA